jgi:hypothetical protein
MLYGIAMVALLVMRRTKKDERPYKVLQCCLFVCFVQTNEDPDLFVFLSLEKCKMAICLTALLHQKIWRFSSFARLSF